MSILNNLKDEIEKLTKFHQVGILRILNKDVNCTLNENKNGIFINLTSVNKETVEEIQKYLEYVKTQEKQLETIENKKDNLTNEFFASNTI